MSRRLLNAIEELEVNGVATRHWDDVGRCLAVCQRCPRWEGAGCSDVSIDADEFAAFLADARRRCERWGRHV